MAPEVRGAERHYEEHGSAPVGRVLFSFTISAVPDMHQTLAESKHPSMESEWPVAQTVHDKLRPPGHKVRWAC